LGLFSLWLVATINFLLFLYLQSNPIGSGLFGNWMLAPETAQMLRFAYGSYDPLPLKYLKYLRNMFTYGLVPPYFGWSGMDQDFVAHGLSWRLPITLLLLVPAFVGSAVIGILLGAFAASYREHGMKHGDVALTVSSLLTYAIPIFLIQLMATVLFGQILRDNYGIMIFSTLFDPPRFSSDARWIIMAGQALLLPILTLALAGIATWVLRSRGLLLDALTQDYILTARAKGLNERKVLYRHALKSILPTIASMIALTIPTLITGSMITELIFGINGIGSWCVKAIKVPFEEKVVYVIDPPVFQAVFFIYATIVIVVNIIADILCYVFDPRIRVGAKR
jgi:peptide/nickel transport system permease protein